MSNRTIALTDTLYDYLLDVSLREPPVLRALREETSRLSQRSMQIAPEQGQFMALLVRLMGARHCLEVGVFTGYSSLAVALALPEEGRIVACDVSEEWTTIARRYWQRAGVSGRIRVDNTLWSGRVADPAVTDADTLALRRFNEALHHDERVDLSLVPIGDGLTLARKRLGA